MQRLLSFASVALFWAFFAASVSAQSLKPVAAAVEQFVAQNGEFRAVRLFTPQASPDKALQQVVADAQFLRLELNDLALLVKTQPEAITLSLPSQGGTILVDLLKVDVVTPDFRVVTSESRGQAVPVATGVHYRGVVRGQDNSLAAFSFFDQEVMGMFSDDQHGDQILGRLDVRDNVLNYILYEDSKLRASNPFSCQVVDADNQVESDDAEDRSGTAVSGCVRVYMEADNELYINKGSLTNTTNYINGFYNQVATLYANETISTQISEIFVWTTADNYSNTSSNTALDQFKALRPTYNGDLAHLVSLGGNNIGGIAYIDVLCFNSYGYGYSNIYASYSNVPTFSWTVQVVTHELGHNLGSNHTQWCGWTGGALDNCYATEGGCAPGPAPTNGGTVMSYCHLASYGINFNNGFGTQPGNKIRDEVSGATCLAPTCSGGSCGTPGGLSATSITQTSATVNWGAVSGAGSYNLQWKASTSGTWINVTGLTGTSYGLSGLTANTTYNYQVQAVCSGTPGSYSSAASFTTLPAASCTDAYEPNNTRTTAKVIPVNTNITAQIATATDNDWNRFSNSTSGRNIKLNLTTLPFDYDLKLYRSSSQLAVSENGGTTSEQIIYNTSTISTSYYAYVYGYNGAFSNSQCYTLRVSLSNTPWLLGDDSEERTDVKEFEIPVVFEDAGFGMYPNPADATLQLEIPVAEEGAAVAVRLFDVAGKLVLQQQPNLSKTDNRLNLNLNELANGVYFVQVRNGDRQHTRKLVIQH